MRVIAVPQTITGPSARKAGFSFSSRTLFARLCFSLVLSALTARAADPALVGKSEEDLQREAAIAAFTQRMKDANYPALFEKAAAEFNVPVDILKGVAFAETRWEHLTWPPGETRSPETGMPRPYGIMSLWSNEFFGESLNEAAKLIGKDPQELKDDPYQNMRGGAALLRKKYEETPKPAGTTDSDIESWRYAIAEYCGIPEPDLKNQHALDVYVFMTKGYHQYGIEWEARPVNLEPMRAEVKAIVAEENRKREERAKVEEAAMAAASNAPAPQVALAKPTAPAKAAAVTAPAELATAAPVADAGAAGKNLWWLIGILMVLLAGSFFALRRQSKSGPVPKQK